MNQKKQLQHLAYRHSAAANRRSLANSRHSRANNRHSECSPTNDRTNLVVAEDRTNLVRAEDNANLDRTTYQTSRIFTKRTPTINLGSSASNDRSDTTGTGDSSNGADPSTKD